MNVLWQHLECRFLNSWSFSSSPALKYSELGLYSSLQSVLFGFRSSLPDFCPVFPATAAPAAFSTGLFLSLCALPMFKLQALSSKPYACVNVSLQLQLFSSKETSHQRDFLKAQLCL